MMKRYISLCLLGSLVFGTAIPAYAQADLDVASPEILAQSQDQEAIAQELIRLLAESDFETAATKYNAEQKVIGDNLKTLWETLIEDYGAFKQQIEVRENLGNVIVVSCEFESKTIDLIVVLNEANEVISLNLPEN
jgi:hypothetical protein